MSCTPKTQEERKGKCKYPYKIIRNFLCGHPPELIKVDITPDGNVQHVLLAGADREEVVFNFSLQRCRRCAEDHQAQRRVTHAKQPVRAVEASQGEVMRERYQRRDGFNEVLHRYRYGNFFEQAMRSHGKLLYDEVPMHGQLEERAFEKLDPVVRGPWGESYERAVRVKEKDLAKWRWRQSFGSPRGTARSDPGAKREPGEMARNFGEGLGGSMGTMRSFGGEEHGDLRAMMDFLNRGPGGNVGE
ncbi:hypothetical protein K505DRAFT_334830 [Melanomma pulvis-pyrius CBS 109.77]|uniref:Uncharacterized protein n=1 Tax=Melanomma pulvis-pyrius CBS 109.77 TaxID=1314802 RepID=A0A6A6XJW0_9PLEO|nr:hypothetical protein K505DRAFT_334830 [Melanomma pulvis-pyrius CBS 109.77]